ncbi:carboxypeptidase inhibitor SmCI-like [Mytilus californianus]|uniref:carboxypeptidase inhibitor SmCI-like n=1 Tax=Mytilus californianus TaxID=6549 RepID=UPI002246A5A2|nr:carboxypeptidase inhibitor SmCI-like [Mytilus californianus]
MQSRLQLISIFLAMKIGVISSINICDLPKVVGSCHARIKRYHYDVQTDQCKRFKYSGCEGNNNNFKTRRGCATACHKRVCTLPKLIGEGQSSVPRWFYNPTSMLCEKFMYGGIHGNENKFRTKRRCERLCNGVKDNPCKPHPGCPRSPPGICRSSIYDIINGVKCFAGCTYPRCKKGSCPTIPPVLPCNSRCNLGNDTQCPGDQLCCQQRCCRDPILEPKRGDCPKDPKPRNCFLRKSECYSDSQCKGKRKCCRFSCQKYCVDPEDDRTVIMLINVEN